MNIHAVYRPFLRHFRRHRWARFAARFGVTETTHILDVGGTSTEWMLMNPRPKVTLVNIRPKYNCPLPQVVADGRALPFGEGTFNIAFSNSVVEHVRKATDQAELPAR